MVKRTKQLARWPWAAALLLAAAWPLCAQEQEKSVNLTGVFTTGFYSAQNQNGREANIATVPAIVNLDLFGFIGNPGFISYRLQPQLSAGSQAPEAGFLSGNGVTLSATFLGRRSFPLTLTYSNVQREQVSYGSLTRISGLRSVSHDRSFGLNWQVRAPDWPQLSFDLNTASNALEPEDPIIPDYSSRSRRYGFGLHDRRWGWTLDSSAHWDRFSSDFANPLEPDLITTTLDRDSSHYQFTAQRPLWSRSQLVLTGGLLDSQNTFNDRPFNQEVRYANALLTFGWGERWRGGFRSGYTSNLLGAEIQEALGQLAGSGGSGSSNSGALVFVPFQTRVSSLSVGGDLHYQAHRDWSFFGGVSQNNVSTPDGTVTAAEADYLNTTGGANFHRTFSWATLNGQYSLNLGRLNYANIPNSRLLGHSFSLMAQRGSVDRLELTASLQASNQRVDQLHALRSDQQSAEFSVGRRVASLVLRGGAGMQRSSFRDGGVDYSADGLSFRASVEHPRVQFRYSRNAVDGNTFQPFFFDPASSAGSSAVLLGLPVRVILSTLRTQTLGLHATPWRRLEATWSWTTSRQEFDSRLNNDYDQFDLRLGYRFRLLTFEAGYARYQQSFLTLTSYERRRLYLRVSRPFRVF